MAIDPKVEISFFSNKEIVYGTTKCSRRKLSIFGIVHPNIVFYEYRPFQQLSEQNVPYTQGIMP